MPTFAQTLLQRNVPALHIPVTDTPPGTPATSNTRAHNDDAPVTPVSVAPTPSGAQPHDRRALERTLSTIRPVQPRFVDGAPTKPERREYDDSPSASPTATATAAPGRIRRAYATTCDFLSATLSPYDPSLVLENSGSVARDHLANERTFLAYTRTSLVIASTGVALVQLFTISANTNAANDSSSSTSSSFTPTSPRLAQYARPLGAATIAFGIFVLGVGLTRHLTIQRALLRGQFPAARLLVAGIALGLAVLVVVVFGVVVS
ncbi:hypothetical protein BD626DRAFT_439539 [Schizophyllum amplum]|uniref:DUF202 domain-containing protein n=1 Tax=Schizophyllum amplum TaxID=97359 RepID=A0A550BY78_9AGAR|nr:hypothetical protein BD626DRAFT_439539 [Auriculariopsis ampla]